MKGYALLVGVNETSVVNISLRGAKFDAERLAWMMEQRLTNKFSVKSLTQETATWNEFTSHVNLLKSQTDESYLFVYITAHTLNSGGINYLCFKDRQVDESSLFNYLNFPSNFKVFIVLNTCFALDYLYPQKTFDAPTYIICSTDKNTESPASPLPNAPTYFTNYFVDTWQEFNYKRFNYDDFFALLSKKVKSSVNMNFVNYDSHNPNSYFNQFTPLDYLEPKYSGYNQPATEFITRSNLYSYQEICFLKPSNSYSFLDSTTINLQGKSNIWTDAILHEIAIKEPNILQKKYDSQGQLIDDDVQYIGVVLVKVDENAKTPVMNVNYMYDDNSGGASLLSNGLVVVLNTENDFEIVAMKRTKGRVTNKIGGV